MRLRLLLASSALLIGVDLLSHGCAHTGAGAVSCAEKATPDLVEGAAAALAGADYEAAITRAFAGVAACVVTAAVEAAIDSARNLKLAGNGNGREIQAAIELHGNAWLAAHRRPTGG